MEIFEHADAMFVTRVTGKPEPSVDWYHGFSRLRPGKTVSLEQEEDGVYRLTMMGCQIQDTGSIRVVATSKAGKAEAEASLVVNGR